MAEKLGPSDGAELGNWLGRLEGSELGAPDLEGSNEGDWLGLKLNDGPNEGSVLGNRLGRLEGSVLGAPDFEGANEGDWLGLKLNDGPDEG